MVRVNAGLPFKHLFRRGGGEAQSCLPKGVTTVGRCPATTRLNTAANGQLAPRQPVGRQQRKGRASSKRNQHESAAPPATCHLLGQVELEAAIKEHRPG